MFNLYSAARLKIFRNLLLKPLQILHLTRYVLYSFPKQPKLSFTKKVSAIFAFSIMLFSCSKNMNEQQQSSASSAEDQQQITKEQINQFIQDEYAQKGSFDWKDASDEMVWTALQHSDKIISVGYKPIAEKSIENRLHTININDANWKAATAAGIAALVWSRFPTLTREDVLNKLTTTASGYPTKNKSYGWGKLNADAATD